MDFGFGTKRPQPIDAMPEESAALFGRNFATFRANARREPRGNVHKANASAALRADSAVQRIIDSGMPSGCVEKDKTMPPNARGPATASNASFASMFQAMLSDVSGVLASQMCCHTAADGSVGHDPDVDNTVKIAPRALPGTNAYFVSTRGSNTGKRLQNEVPGDGACFYRTISTARSGGSVAVKDSEKGADDHSWDL